MADASETEDKTRCADARRARENKVAAKIVLITEDYDLQNAVKQYFSDVDVIARTMLLMYNWMLVRDRALSTATAVWIEIIQSRTAEGTRNDRKITSRIMSLAIRPGSETKHIAIFSLAGPIPDRWQRSGMRS